MASGAAEVHVLIRSKHAHRYPREVHVHHVPDTADIGKVLTVARPLAAAGLAAVIAVQERALISAAVLRSYYGIPGPDLGVVTGFADKLMMKRRLRARGLPVADFRPVAALAELPAALRALGAAGVFKPAVSAGARNTWVVPTPAAAQALLADPAARALEHSGAGMLLERRVTMDAELHCDAIVEDGRAVAFSASQYFAPLLAEMGGFIGSRTLADHDPRLPRLHGLHDDAVRALGLRSGVTHLEVFDTATGPVIGEITCRPAGGGVPGAVLLKHGWSLWAGLVATALGDPAVPAAPARPDARTAGWCGLPGRNGRITAMTDVREIAAVPGVENVEVHHRVGDVVSEKQTSTFNAAVVTFRVADEAAVDTLLGRLRSIYRIEVEPVAAAAVGIAG